MLSFSPPGLPARFRCAGSRFVLALALIGACVLIGLAPATAAAADEAAPAALEDVTILPPFQVKGVQMEDFGFRYIVTIQIPGPDSVTISEVLPHTAAAKAGLRPGEQIVKIDGKSFSLLSLALRPDKLQQRKWAELEAGKPNVSLVLEVRAWGAKATRTVTLVIPSPPPHWGSAPWTAPADRTPAVIAEPGPLAMLARDVIANGIWSWNGMTVVGGVRVPLLGYEWRIVQPSGTHRIWVTQQRGKTEITLEYRAPAAGVERSRFSTSPSGALDEGHSTAPKIKGQRREFSPDELRALFAAEIDFWLHRVGRVTGRWPFEPLPGKTEAALAGTPGGARSTGVSIAPNAARPVTAPGTTGAAAPLAASFLKLPPADPAQRALFSDALGKLGSDGEVWAFTETGRGFEDARVTTMRYDPSKPPAERSVLLKVDGKAPKPAHLSQWRAEGRGTPAGLGELPALSSLVDLGDVRISADEPAAIVFELPVKANNAEFPADKFSARFRVNKTHRGFEDFAVKLREPMSVAGVAKVTDAGLEARFQSLDPALAPQPVLLKLGGGVRVLLVKFSRSLEITRTDFKRVTPLYDPLPPSPAPHDAPALRRIEAIEVAVPRAK